MVYKRKPSDPLNPWPVSSRYCGLGSFGLGGYRTVVGGHGVGQALASKADLVEGDIRGRAVNGDLQCPSIV